MSMEMQAPQGHTMATVGARASAVLEFTAEQRALIRDAYTNGATDQEFAVLMEIARARQLNPLMRQIHFVKRWDGDKRREVWSAQVAIDGLRAIAERTGLYDGQDEPEFVESERGALVACKVRVYRKDWPRPAVGVAYYEEFVQRTKEGKPNRMWSQMPRVMLAKVAESIALRKAFPEDTSGLYTPEEMGQADNGRKDREEPAAAPRRAQVKAQRPELAPPPVVVQEQPAAAPSAPQEPRAQSPRPDAAVQSAGAQGEQREAASQAPGVADLCASIRQCRTDEDVARCWVAAREDLRAWSTGEKETAWHEACARCAEIREQQFNDAKAWLAARVKELNKPTPPGGGGGGSKPSTTSSTGAQGSAAESTPANDATQARVEAWTTIRGGIEEHVARLSSQHIENSARAHAKDFGPLRAHAMKVYAQRHEKLRHAAGNPLHEWEAAQDVARWFDEGPRARVVQMPTRAPSTRTQQRAAGGAR